MEGFRLSVVSWMLQLISSINAEFPGGHIRVSIVYKAFVYRRVKKAREKERERVRERKKERERERENVYLFIHSAN